MSHSQNASGLVCGLSTRNTRTPRSAHNSTMSRQAAHRFFQSGDRDKMLKIAECAELRGDGFVSASRATDGVRTPGVVGSGHEAVVWTLAIGDADRVDR